MATPLFSICIPAYKSRFLHECITSILSQSYGDFELLVLNDCSPEPISEIVGSFNDLRISVYNNKVNVGAENLVDNWNQCLKLSNGKFIVMMGDDDRLEPDYLEEFIRLIDKYPDVKVFHCRAKIIDSDSRVIGLTQSWPEFESVYNSIWHRLNDHRAQFISDFVYDRSFLEKNGGFFKLPLAWGSDDITAYIAASFNGLAHTNKTVFNYRRSIYTISSSGSTSLKIKALLEYSKWLQEFLASVPTDLDDKILHQELVHQFAYKMQKKKILSISSSLDGNFVSSLFENLRFRKIYEISIKELGFAIFDYLKRQFTSSTYKNK